MYDTYLIEFRCADGSCGYDRVYAKSAQDAADKIREFRPGCHVKIVARGVDDWK